MAELTADQAIEKLKTLKPEEQRLVLSRLTPEKRQAIGKSAFTSNPKGEGLYRMLPASNKGFTRNEDELLVPYSRVAHAQNAGYHLHPDEAPRFKKDQAAEGKTPSAIGTLQEKFEKAIQPVPSAQDTAQKGSFPIDNTDRAALRVLYGIPGYIRDVASAAEELRSGRDPEALQLTNLLDPTKVPQQLTEQFQQDWKSGDRKLAFSNLVGTLAGMVIAHKATGAAREAVAEIPVPKLPEAVRGAVRETLGTYKNTRAVVGDFEKKAQATRQQHVAAEKLTAKDIRAVDAKNEEVQKDLAARNDAARQKVNDSNLKQLRAEAQARLDVLKANREKIENYDEQVAKTKAENDQNLRRERMRQKVEGQLNDASKRLDTKYQRAFKTATSTYNATWNKWRDLVKTQMAPMKTVVDTIKAQEASMNPQQQSIFRDILRETQPTPEEMTDFERDRDALIKGLGYKAKYDDLPPERKVDIDNQMKAAGYTNLNDIAVAEVPASRLHGWKSQLERAVRTTSDGTIRYAVGKVLQNVRGLEEQVSANVPGAAEQLTKARAITGPYFDAFFKSPDELPKEAGRSLREQSPEYAKEKAQQDRLNRIAAYDPTITGLAQHVDNLRTALKQIPKPKELADLPPKPVHVPKPTPGPLKEFTPETKEQIPYKEPREKRAEPKAPNISEENAAFIADKLRDYGRWGQWIVRLIAGGLAGHALFKGDLSAFSNDLLIGQMAVTMLTDALRKPSVIDWLSAPSKEDLEMIDKLPPQDAVRMREALNALAREDIRKDPALAKKRISPVMAAFLAGQAAHPAVPQKYKQTATAPNGHKIGSNDDGKTWYDVETGKRVE